MRDIGGQAFSVFGLTEEAYVPANIRDDAFLEQLARRIHEAYVAWCEARGETKATNRSMVPWDKLPKDLQDAQVAQAAGIGSQLEAINAVVVPESAQTSDFSFTPAEIEALAEMDHKRWMNERIARGWSYGPYRDNTHKVHPDLADWDALDVGTREKDRDAVRAIPGILHKAGYQILRLPSSRASMGR